MATEKIKVLMVDDEVQFRQTTKKILDTKGFETLMAAAGQEALAQLANEPDVVVLDLRMPGMNGNETLAELKRSFSPQLHTGRIMETGHPSLLVFDAAGSLKGILAIIDLLEAIMPGYLSAPKPSTADSMQYSPMFWTGMFTREVSRLAAIPVSELMSPTPPAIDADANLMEAAYMMVWNRCRRMVVLERGKIAGVIREHDLFFEMERVLQ